MSDNNPNVPQDPNDPYSGAGGNDPVPPPPGQTPPGDPAAGQPASPYGQPGQQPPYGQPGESTPYGQPDQQQPYGQQQPFGQQAPYGQPQGQPDFQQHQSAGVQVGDAFSYGWKKFQENVGGIVLGVLAYFAVIVVISVIFFAVLIGGARAGSSIGNDSAFGAIFGFSGLLLVAIIMFLTVFMQAGVTRAALDISHGRRIEFATFFRFDDFGRILGAVVLVGLGTAIGTLLCYVPGIVFGFFAQFTLFYVIDKRQGAVDALKSSFALVNRNIGTVVVLYIGVLVANWIGSAVCGIGVLVSYPVAILATTYVYRRLNGEAVAA